MPKNIVIYSDGTGQDGGVRPEQRISNVYKMYRVTRIHPDNAIDPSRQVCFYDPGLGTDVGATALTAPVRFVQKLLASVTGRGITRNIAECCGPPSQSPGTKRPCQCTVVTVSSAFSTVISI
jgi:uncharacterized protein (DUF2235 family)